MIEGRGVRGMKIGSYKRNEGQRNVERENMSNQKEEEDKTTDRSEDGEVNVGRR